MEENRREEGKAYGMDFGILRRRVFFRNFCIVLTDRGAMFETYTGYHVWTTPFVTGLDGRTQEKSLYAWLVRMVGLSDGTKGKEKEMYEGTDVKRGEFLEAMETLTACNLLEPQVVFTDMDKAGERALAYMRWISEKAGELEREAARKPVEDGMEEMRALSGEWAKIEREEVLGDLDERINGDAEETED